MEENCEMKKLGNVCTVVTSMQDYCACKSKLSLYSKKAERGSGVIAPLGLDLSATWGGGCSASRSDRSFSQE